MKKVLIISYSYPPSNAPAAQRPYALAKFLDKSKFEVTVITCGNADSSLGFDTSVNEQIPDVNLIKVNSRVGSNVANLRNSGMTDDSKKSGVVSKLKKTVFSTFSKLIVPDKGIFWYPKVKSYLKSNKELIYQSDIVFSTSPLFTNHLIGGFIKKKNKDIKWLADFRDFHFVENWSRKGGYKKYINRGLEKRVITKANRIIFISKAMQDVYEGYYPKFKAKMDFVYNGFDLDDFSKLKIEPLISKKLIIFYAGSFYKGVRSPLPLLSLLDEAFKKNLLKKSEVTIRIAGNFEQELLSEAQQYESYNCIEFLGRIPRSEVLERLTKSSLLWLIVGNEITHYTGVPIKFYEYLAARRPIINFAPKKSEPTKIIEELNLGQSFDSLNFDAETAVEQFQLIINNFRNQTLHKPLSQSTAEKFTRDKQALIFQELMD